MSFGLLSPALAAALVASCCAVVAVLYHLRPPPRRLSVSSLLLWRAARSRPSPLERLRWWLSLLLATAIAVLLALVLAGLRIGQGDGPLLLVVDTSPSMGARAADGRSRLEHAIAEAESLLGRLGGGARVRVADTCGEPGSPGSPAAARRDLARLAPCPEAEASAPPLRAGERAIFLSDGVSGLEPPAGAGLVSVFEAATNVGVTAFEAEVVEGGAARAVVELVNGSDAARATTLTLACGSWSAEERLELGSGEALAVVRDLPAGLAGLIEARVGTPGDALADDDRALAWLGPPRWRLQVLGTPPRHLLIALQLDPRVELLDATGEADAVVAVGVEAPADRPALVVAARDAASAPAPRLIDAWQPEHPLFRGAPPGDVAVRPLTAAPDAALEVVASAGGSPAILARREPVRRIHLAFPLEASSWTRQASFPVFLGNALEWLLGPAAIRAAPGEVLVPLPGAQVFDPAGTRVQTWSAEGVTRFRADRPGAWLARIGSRSLPVLVSPAGRAATLVNRSRYRDAAPAAPALPSAGRWPALPPLLALVAALLLAFEWWSWRRRLTV